jgi:alpha-glucosidase
MLLTLPGSPYLYQGEELGLVDAVVPADRVVDPGGRDGCRAPIPWDGSEWHGWHAEPWLPFAPETDVRHVAALRADPTSILHWYRRILRFRRTSADLRSGAMELVDLGADVLAYRRGELLVVLNLGEDAVDLRAPHRLVLRSDAVDEETTSVIRAVDSHVAVVAAGVTT